MAQIELKPGYFVAFQEAYSGTKPYYFSFIM